MPATETGVGASVTFGRFQIRYAGVGAKVVEEFTLFGL